MIPIVTIKRRRKAGATVSTSAYAMLPASFTTLSGTWRVDAVSGEPGVFLWTLDENPGWSSVMVTNEGITDRTVTTNGHTLLCPPNAVKFAQSAAPVTINAQWIRDAVTAKRWVAYDKGQAADFQPMHWKTWGGPASQKGSMGYVDTQTYDPNGMNGISKSDCLVGTISGQGGEYVVSRGADDDPDAIVMAAAHANEDITGYQDNLYKLAFSFAGYPGTTFFDGHVLRDPQRPITGNHGQFEYSIGTPQTNPDVTTYVFDDWKMDGSHLCNTGWALWLGTEDPRIGMLVQAHAQFMLAVMPGNYRVLSPHTAGAQDSYEFAHGQEREMYNGLGSAWRAKDVTSRITASQSDVMIWASARVQKMYNDTTAELDGYVDTALNASPGPTLEYHAKAVSTPFPLIKYANWTNASEGTVRLTRKASFMDQQYGSVHIYLRAMAGEAFGLKVMTILAKHFVARMYDIGGATGVDGMQGNEGSSVPVGPRVPFYSPTTGAEFDAPGTPTFSDPAGWAAWVLTLDLVSNDGHRPPPPRTSFKYSDTHTVIQTQFLLRAVKELILDGKIAAIPNIDNALTAFEAARVATGAGEATGELFAKHMYTTFTGA